MRKVFFLSICLFELFCSFLFNSDWVLYWVLLVDNTDKADDKFIPLITSLEEQIRWYIHSKSYFKGFSLSKFCSRVYKYSWFWYTLQGIVVLCLVVFLWSASGLYNGVSLALVICIHNLFLFILQFFGLCSAELQNNGSHQMTDTLFSGLLIVLLKSDKMFWKCSWIVLEFFEKNWVATLISRFYICSFRYFFQFIRNVHTAVCAKGISIFFIQLKYLSLYVIERAFV